MSNFSSLSTLSQIEAAIPLLTASDLTHLERIIHAARRQKLARAVADSFALPPLSLGVILRPMGGREERYDEMLEGRG